MRRLSLAVIVVLALVGAACTGNGTTTEAGGEPAATPTSPPATASPTTESDPVATTGQTEGGGSTLVVAISSDPGHLNPAITTSGATHTASELLYNGLVELDENGEPVPGLAESWDITEDGAVYTFDLVDGVVWHDDEPFTSADVEFAFEEVILQFHSRSAASIGNTIEDIETPDEDTVVFRFTEPYAPLLQQLNVTEAPIVPQHIYEGTDPNENPANLEPVGTGPFRFISYTPDSEIRLEAHPDYFKEGLPHLDEVVMRIIPEEASQLIALEQGEVDWLWGVPGPDLERLQGSGEFEFLETSNNPGGQNCIMTVSFNLENPMFQDQRVREALATGLNRQAFLDNVLFGQGAVAAAPIHSGIGFAHAEGLDMPAYDPTAAAALLDEAGWVEDDTGTRAAQGVDGVEDGTPLAFDFLHFPTFAAYGELLRAQLADLGADVELRPLEPPVFAETVFTERDFDTNIVSYCNGTDPEIGVKRMYISSNIQPIPFSNSSAYSNEQVDSLFDEAATTIDTDARAGLYRQIQEILVAELPYFWIVETTAVRAHTDDCMDFTASGHFAETARCSE